MNERVLLIDDEQDFMDVLAERMRDRGMNVSTTTSPLEALDKAGEESYDAVILDLMMPEMDGLEALTRLRAKNPDLQIILLTGHATVEKGIEAMKLGAMDFLEKPIDIQALNAKIKEAKAQKMLLVEKRTEEVIKNIIGCKGW
ncbi:response regulator receiver protein [Desulfobulbus propionicus DSM 2032]|jgi:DNA-binding NtrC family response regulator|uniref:Response regulator receiver protein n=1 Tax=Desulfobulbus propionicus (strain ATCC 33891 / DSM 2032 / VKM B-1956 / 1pr3) TaxID=577650 RepID=A0A7U3YP57_DESPD|nr:response regulator [Desulfobulbus propionicus]ADW18981.1 response regulator receiver protein [Desulfobulbus propionicus DSM 2032]